MSNLPAWDFLNDVNLAVDELEAQMARATSPEPTNQNELAAFDLEEYHEMGLPSNPNKKQETFRIWENEFPMFTQIHIRLWLFWAGILRHFYTHPRVAGHDDLRKRLDKCINVLQNESSDTWMAATETTKKYHEYTLGIHPTCEKPEADEFIGMYEECEYIALGTLLEVNAWFIRRLTVGLNHVIGPKLQYIKQKMAPHLEDVDYKRALPDDCPKLLDFRNKLKERWHTFIRDPSKPLSEEHRNLFAHREHQ
ncbi:hypothetical protein FQN51_002217 [Onygenales sp. PD_10]|nr:hypothetical protein FQN51_002217 [Onygenales sp. PD_10]